MFRLFDCFRIAFGYKNVVSNIQIDIISKNHPKFNNFVDLSVEYINKYWPHVFKNMSLKESQIKYATELEYRLNQGSRGLFLARRDAEYIGIANAYCEKEILYVAEFYIKEEYRRQGIGRQLLAEVKNWGIKNNANKLHIEVDRDLELANNYWKSFGFDLSIAERNIYTASLKKNK